jgi:phosphoribosylformylglycinamidine synthase
MGKGVSPKPGARASPPPGKLPVRRLRVARAKKKAQGDVAGEAREPAKKKASRAAKPAKGGKPATRATAKPKAKARTRATKAAAPVATSKSKAKTRRLVRRPDAAAPEARLPVEVATFWVEVSARPGTADPDGVRLCGEAKALGIDARAARSAVVYELEGTDAQGAETLAEKLLSDPLLERARVVSRDDLASARGAASPGPGERVATCIRKPGVMDPVALSLVAAAHDLGVVVKDVRVARRVYLECGAGAADTAIDRDIERLAARALGNEALDRVLVGPVAFPAKARIPARERRSVRREVPLLGLDADALLALSRERTLALDLPEMKAVQAHYAKLGREPSDLELETIAQTWSEHCKHKTLTGPIELTETDVNGSERRETIGNLLKETIFGATKELDLPRCVSVFEDNAGVIRLDDETGIAIKVETHNHPSAIEPYGGAGTGVGGVIRDILGTGLGAAPIASLDVFCVGDLHASEDDVPEGALHPRRLLAGVVSGVRDYGNRMGIPTVAGSLISEKRYVGNPLVYCGTIGTIPLDRVKKAARPGDRVVLVGGRTGRDGIHGATFSSDPLTSESERVSSGAVQIGNAIEEKKLGDVLIQLRDQGALEAVTDCGAGGLSSAVGEMARETGASVDLTKVPLKYEGLSPWETWVSEAQERMVLAVPPSRTAEVIAAFAAEDVEAVDLGVFRDDGRLIVTVGDEVVGDLDQDFLHDGLPRTPLRATFTERAPAALELPRDVPAHGEALRRLLAHPSIASREWIVRQYDHEVQGLSALKALQGARSDGPGDAVAVAAAPGASKGVLVGLGCQPRFSDADPYLSAWASIDEAIRNVVASGGDPDACALLDNFSWGDCRRDPRELGGIVRAARACREAALLHRAPFISGKDSLNNTYVQADGTRISIPGTLLITCIAVYEDVAKLVSMDLKAPWEVLYLVGETRAELGCSHWLEVARGLGGVAPRPARETPALYRKLHEAMKEGLVSAAHDCSEGGLAVALAEMAFAGEVGARIELARIPRPRDVVDEAALLFSETAGRILVSVPPPKVARFEKLMAGPGVAPIGETIIERRLQAAGFRMTPVLDEPLDVLKETWRAPLFSLYGTGP